MADAPLVAVVGPTGSGKSELALRLAEECNGEVINCDSLQVYRYFDIGTAKLNVKARRGVPHHLIDILDPDQLFTAGEYARRGRDVLRDVAARGRLPVVAGGTGFYLRALIDGLFQGPARDDAVRQRLEARHERRPGSLHRILKRLDPAAARFIHPHDVPKTIRALEVCLLTRRPLSSWFAGGRDALRGFTVLKLGLAPARPALYAGLDARCERMFAAGLVEEVRGILARGFSPAVKPLESHGYRQALQFLNGELSAAEACDHAKRNTRHYAKRQGTWFRRDPAVEWIQGFGDEPAVSESAIARVKALLAYR